MDHARHPRILIVDDDPGELDRTLETIRRLGLGYEARIAHGGFEALDYLLGRGRFHERRRHPLPDLILMKLAMLPLDGAAVLRRIEHLEILSRIPVIAVCATEDECRRATIAGLRVESCLVKPILALSLSELVRQFTPPRPESLPMGYTEMRAE
jgi:two-component system response regulator